MSTLRTGLNCLAHPLSLISLAVLLLNDHVLKLLVPSWLTGKLSDFAGLFFFPFLLAALLGFLLRERCTNRQIGLLAFGITAVWFVMMKTTIWGNVVTEQLASLILQTRTQIVQDPTDVMAVSIMIPGWVLWDRTKTTRPPKWAWLVLLLAAFAAMATSPYPLSPRINRVVWMGDTFVAGGVNSPSATSTDGGKTWTVSEQPFPKNAPSWEVYRGICEPNLPTTCYRLTQNFTYHDIEWTQDGGKNWSIFWEIPRGRLPLLERLGNQNCGMSGCQRQFEPGLTDIALGAPFDANGRATLIAAMGTEGVMVRTPTGEWSQHGVGPVVPTPMRITSLDQVSVINPELEISLYLGLAALVIFAAVGWEIVGGTAAVDQMGPVWTILGFTVIIVLVGGVMIVSKLGGGLELWGLMGWYAYAPVLGLIFIGLFISNSRISKMSTDVARSEQVVGLASLGALVFSVTVWFPMVLWAFGVIEWYWSAVILWITFGMVEIHVINRFISRKLRATPNSIPVTESHLE